MRILYVVSRPLEINTSASIRNRATLLGLVENGHEVELLTTMPDERHSAYDAAMAVSDTVKTTYVKLGGVQAAARLGRRFKLLRGLRRLAARVLARREIYDNLKGIVSHAGLLSLKEKQYDLIISSSDPKSSHLFVLELLRTQGGDFQGKWIQIWGDPFASDITLAAGAKQKAIAAEEHPLHVHAEMIATLVKDNGTAMTAEAAEATVRDFVNRTCAAILDNTAVFKQDAAGRAAFDTFLRTFAN